MTLQRLMRGLCRRRHSPLKLFDQLAATEPPNYPDKVKKAIPERLR